MYNYIIGTVTDIGNNYVVIENNKIGYKIHVANPYSFELDNEYKVYLHNQIREDEYSLYGFTSKDEYELFIKLLSVKGLGPKVALPIFAVSSLNGIIDAINRENIIYLKKFPKVGDKLARQIILDLKGKLNTEQISHKTSDNDELVMVLESLGYKQTEINKVIIEIDNDLNTENKVKEALKLLMK